MAGKAASFFRLLIFYLLEGKTQPAPLLFSPFFTASYAKARLAFAVKIHPFPPALRFVQGSRLAQSALTEASRCRLCCASCGTVVPLKVTLGKSAILPRLI